MMKVPIDGAIALYMFYSIIILKRQRVRYTFDYCAYRVIVSSRYTCNTIPRCIDWILRQFTPSSTGFVGTHGGYSR